jgi:hypothetical protein
MQGKAKAQQYAYLVMVHNIFYELVMNTYQTGIHIVLIGGVRKWEIEGFQHVKVHGMEYKHQVIVVVSSTVNGQCLPF